MAEESFSRATLSGADGGVITASTSDTGCGCADNQPSSAEEQDTSPAEPAAVNWEDLDAEVRQQLISNTTQVDLLGSTPNHPPAETLSERWLRVFDAEEVERAQLIAEFDGKQYETLRPVYDSARDLDGRREIPNFDAKQLSLRLQKLSEEMPNFAPAIDYLLAEFGFLLTGNVKDFRVEPLMLVGGPGLGKTRFVGQLAAILGVKYEKISAGTLQTSSDLSGSSRIWSNTRPGRISRLIAESREACPICLLDEIDKLSESDQYPVTPALLELLEPDSAKTFRDDCLEIRFDASRLIHVATANEVELVSAPLLSRFRSIEIKYPDSEQRRSIIVNIFREIIGSRECEIGDDVIDSISEAEIDMRELRRQLRESVGRALLNDERRLRIHHLNIRAKKERRRIGFV